jgi:hypothetical protein
MAFGANCRFLLVYEIECQLNQLVPFARHETSLVLGVA